MSKADQTSGGMVANIKELGRRIKAHNVTVSAAGIAFYGLLALVPTLVALVSLYGLVADPSDIQSQLESIESLDDDTRGFLETQLNDIVGAAEEGVEARESSSSVGRWFGLFIGLALALFSASGAVQKLIGTVSVAYEARESRPGWKLRGMAYLFTAAAIVGVALMILTIGVIPAVLDELDLGDTASSLASILPLPILGVLFSGALTVLYRYGPDREVRTPWLNPGAIVATLLFVFFSIAFSVYSANIGLMPASYGLLGSIAALMIFLQLTAVAVIVGAEVNGAIEVRRMPGQAVVGQPFTGGRPIGSGVEPEAKPLSFGKALAGVAALLALGRSIQKD